MWKDNKKRIRRFLRDPNANIWTDGFLRRNWNDAQYDFSEATNFLEQVEALRVPPQYGFSYLNDWEWNYCQQEKKYKAFHFQQQSRIACSYKWETQQLGISIWTAPDPATFGEDTITFGDDTVSYSTVLLQTTGLIIDEGHAFAHPWEVYMVTNANKLSPIWFPENFKTAKLVAWDKEPIEYSSQKNISSTDMSWKTYSGEPYCYFRIDETSNEFYLYPKPSSPTWDDTIGNALESQVLFDSANTANQELGALIDTTGYYVHNQDLGISIEQVDTANNVLLIYETQSVDIETEGDEPGYPKFLQKYIEYDVLEKAYSANTDGKIGSLQDYWKWRKELGYEFLRRFNWKRISDRDFRLTGQASTARRFRKEPRLPDEYPYVR